MAEMNHQQDIQPRSWKSRVGAVRKSRAISDAPFVNGELLVFASSGMTIGLCLGIAITEFFDLTLMIPLICYLAGLLAGFLLYAARRHHLLSYLVDLVSYMRRRFLNRISYLISSVAGFVYFLFQYIWRH